MSQEVGSLRYAFVHALFVGLDSTQALIVAARTMDILRMLSLVYFQSNLFRV